MGRVCVDELLEAEHDEAREEEAGEGEHVDLGSPCVARLAPPQTPCAIVGSSRNSPRATAGALCRLGPRLGQI